ncbi:MAG TPA: alpha/beta fold hydrolase [Kouleothrix sp.]|uniref:alpha/beta fold hydrolase n=1 Tax=Kouleothrix sp. TaxID=2779161 RepID=UPI002C17F22E|nr:alpha/beta fold hydrolase [Kouleothrix sp.]HRC76713.1 alpha/beta fold hydrolase [Kouleothrix sp.]
MQAYGHTQPIARRARVGAASIYYETHGSGAPLVLLHGFSGSTRWWGRNVAALARQFQVYIPDLAGFGQSRSAVPFELADAARHVARWMDQAGLERASMVGHSMGGLIAAELAADAPERVARLVLVDSAGLGFDASDVPPVSELLPALRYLPTAFIPPLLGDMRRAGLRTLVRASRALATYDIRAKLAAIRAPALIVWGRYDPMIPLAVGRALARELPHARLAVIDAAGHNPMWDQPAAFNRLLCQFLAHEPA